MDSADASRSRRRAELFAAPVGWLRTHAAVLAFLAATFVGRFFLADRNSYWYDEILSIWVYGNRWDDLGQALDALARISVHPPLYQSVLYGWMQVFGDGEAATRSLSNLYVTLAALFLYLIVQRVWGRGVALISTAGFSVMYMSVYYALESRSYAQTIFLVTLSSWLLLRILDPARAPRRRVRVAEIVGLVAVNTALMLTHYYDVFWLIAQAAFVGAHLVLARPRVPWWPRIVRALVITLTPQLLFLLIWGPILLEQYRERRDDYGTDGAAAQGPLELVRNGLVHDNLTAPFLVFLALALGIAVSAVWCAVRILRTPREPDHAAWTYLYLVTWAAAPLLVVFAAFTVLGVERYEPRYFVFSPPPLVPLIAIPLAVGILAIGRRLANRSDAVVRVGALALTLGVVAALTLPGGYDAATTRKTDWRAIARDVVDIVHNDPDHHYAVGEMTFSGPSRMYYYLARYSDDVRGVGALARSEVDGDYEEFLAELPEPGSGDRVIMIFNHHRADDFPKLLEALGERYTLLIAQLDPSTRGFLVYEAVPEPEPASTDEPATVGG